MAQDNGCVVKCHDIFLCVTPNMQKSIKMVGFYKTYFFGIRHMGGNQRSFWVNLCSFLGTNMRVPDFDVCWLCSPGQHAKKGGSRNLMVDVQPPFFGVSRKPSIYIYIYKFIKGSWDVKTSELRTNRKWWRVVRDWDLKWWRVVREGDLILMQLTMMKGGARVRLDYDEGWCAM